MCWILFRGSLSWTVREDHPTRMFYPKLLINYLRLLHLQSIQYAFSHIVVLNWLFESCAVIIHHNEMVEEKVRLSLDVWCEVIVLSEYRARSENSCIGEGFSDNLLSDSFGLEIQRLWVLVSSCGWEMNQSVDTFSGTSFSDSFSNFDVDILKISSMFNFLSGSCQIDNNVGVFNKSFDKFLISQVCIPLNPRFV